MIDLAIKITALLGAAWVAAFLLRGRAASIRHAVWIGLMAAALALPAFAALVPPVELAWLPADPPGILQPRSSGRVFDAAATGDAAIPAPEVLSAVASSAPVSASRTPRVEPPTLSQALLTGWFVVAMLLVLRVVVAHVQARRVLAACTDAPDALERAVSSVAAELGVAAPPVRVASTGTMPAVIGLLRPSIMLPAEAASWTAERLRVVLLHECAHVRRRDALLQLISSVATAAYWWHPLTWLAAQRIVRERELACDDLVIASGTPGTQYAAHLLDIARAMRPARESALGSLAMARPSELEGRLIALLEERPRDARPARALAIGVGIALVAVSVVAPLTLVARAVIADTENIQPQAAQAESSRASAPAQARVEAHAAAADGPARESHPAPQVQAVPAPTPAPAPVNAAFTAALLNAVNDEDEDIRLLALSALSRAGSPEAVPMLVKALQDRSEDIRMMALLGLVQLDHPDARAHFAKALQDESEDVRTAAVLGLKKMSHPERRAMLLRAATDVANDVRTMVALALGDEAGEDVDAMLVKLSSDVSADVRRAALLAIAQRAGGGATWPPARKQ